MTESLRSTYQQKVAVESQAGGNQVHAFQRMFGVSKELEEERGCVSFAYSC